MYAKGNAKVESILRVPVAEAEPRNLVFKTGCSTSVI